MARQSRKLIRLKAKTDAAIAQLRPFREAELRLLEPMAQQSRSRVSALVAQAAGNPSLSRMLALLKFRQVEPEPESKARPHPA